MLLLKVERRVIDDLEDLTLVVATAEGPELLEQGHGQQILLGQQFEDVSRPLHELQMRLLGVPQDVKYAMVVDPLD